MKSYRYTQNQLSSAVRCRRVLLTKRTRPLGQNVSPTPRRGTAWVMLLLALGFLTAWQSLVAQTYSVSNNWSLVGATKNLDTANHNRGMSYGLTNQVVVNNTSTHVIALYDGATGVSNGAVNITGVSGGTFTINKLGFGADGVMYGANLNTSISGSSFYKVYSWTNWTTAPLACYASSASDPVGTILPGKRLGDTFAVSGAGSNTLMLAAVGNTSGGYSSNVFALLSTPDGINFTSTVLTVTGLPAPGSGVQFGFAFYTNNTFMVVPNGGAGNIYLVQFPANLASLPSPVTATTIATNSGILAASWLDLSYNPNAGLLAVHANAAAPMMLYRLPSANFTNMTLLASNGLSFSTSTSINGNETGDVALGGNGDTNAFYVLDTSAGLQAAAISFTAAPVPPTITSQPVGVSNVYPPQTLTVAATGTSPLHYQWYTITGATTNAIAGATTNFYTITTPVTNNYEVIITNSAGTTNSAVVTVSLLSPITNAVVSNLWILPPGTSSDPWLGTDDATRGLGYDTNSSRLLVASHSGGTGLYILDGNTGTNLGSLNTTALYTGATFAIDQVGVGGDGVVYAGNLAQAGQVFTLNSWPAPTNGATSTLLFEGDPGNGSGERWGDNMAVRGSGPNTQILLTSRGGTNVCLFTTSDGQNFSANTIPVSGVPATFGGSGVSFGAGNTFWAKNYGGDLYEIAFDPVGLTASVVFDYAITTQIPSAMSGVGVDPVHNIFAGVSFSETPNDLQLYQLTGTADAPVLFNEAFFPTENANGNVNASVVLSYPRAYAMDVNNGIIALTYGTPATTRATISQNPSGGTVYTADPAFSFTVGVAGSLPIYYQWQYNSVSNLATATNILGATNRTYTLTYPTLSAAGWYDVIVHNLSGAATSPPVQLTIMTPVTSTVVTQLWSMAPNGTNLDSNYGTRGLAYDTNTGTLLLCSSATTNIYILSATNGSYLGALNTAGLPESGYVGFVLNLVGVGDDGVVYGANLADTANGDQFSFTEWPSVADGQAPSVICFTGDPGSGSRDRWGDTLAVRGAGANTAVLCGSYNGTNVVLFTTTDGMTFTPNLISVPGVPAGFAGLGIAFGAGNTFWAKGGHNYDLRQVAFDPNTFAATVLQNYIAPPPSPGQVPDDLTGIAVDVANNILGGVCFNDAPNDLQLYELSGNTNAPGLFEQAFFLSNNPNSQENAQVTLKGGRAYALDVNNGLVALSYGVPAAPGVTITSVAYAPGNVTIDWNNAFSGHAYQLQSTTNLAHPTWINVGAPVSTANPTASASDTSPSVTAKFYRVVSN